MIGPLMLCMLKNECTYLTLFQKMAAHVPGLKGYLQGYASDHKKSPKNLLAYEFPAAVSYICVVHAKRNISEKFSELGLSKALSSEIIKKFFGQGGLLYCKKSESSEFLCNKLTAKWNDLEGAEKKNLLFSQYFEIYKKNSLCDHMRLCLSKENGFGSSQLVTKNPIGSVNAVIKRWNNFSPKDMCTFLDDIKALIDEQQENFQKAFIQFPSPSTVRPEFKGYIIQDYFSLDSKARTLGRKKIASILVDTKQYMSVVKYKCVPVPFADTHDSPETLPGHFSLDKPFDILRNNFTDIDIYHLPKKANEIAEAKNIIPGFSNKLYFVKNTSDTHHSIQCLANQRIDFNKLCMGFKNREICSDTIVVAIYRNWLNAYLNLYLKRYNPNITKMSTTGVNVNAEKKTAPRKRFRSKSPDLVGQTQQHNLIKNTAGKILNEENTEIQMVVQNISNYDMKIKIRRKTPVVVIYRPI